MSQPSFVPVSRVAEVRLSRTLGTPDLSSVPKVGLQRSARLDRGPGRGTPSPSEGFAFTLAHRSIHHLDFDRESDRHDTTVAVGLLVAQCASVARRAPTSSDVVFALNELGIDVDSAVPLELLHRIRGISHSYEMQRKFVDSFDSSEARLNEAP